MVLFDDAAPPAPIARPAAVPRLALAALALMLLGGCAAASVSSSSAPAQDAPGTTTASFPTIADPQQYVRDGLLATDNPLGRPEYHLQDVAVMDEAIATAMARKRRDWETLPQDQAELDAFIPSAARTWRLAQMETPARRQQIEAQIAAYFQNPVVRQEGDTVIVDLGLLPGELEEFRNRWTITESVYADNTELTDEQVRRGFQLGHATFPGAKDYRVIAIIPYGSRSRRSIEYLYDGDRDRLQLFHNAKVFRSPEAIGGVEALLDGRASTRLADLETPRTEIPKGPWGEDL